MCRGLHLLGVILWLGGLLFESLAVTPISRQSNDETKNVIRKINTRFVGIVWVSIWMILITGVMMMYYEQRLLHFQFTNRWSILFGLKQLTFILMVFYAYGYSRMLKYLNQPSSDGGFDAKAETYRNRLNLFRNITTALGITAVLLSVGLVYLG